MDWEILDSPQGTIFKLKVKAGAGYTAIIGSWNKAIKLKVGKKAEDGAANKECIKFLAKKLRVPQKNLTILKGEFSSLKVIRVKALTADEVKQRLL